MKFKKTKITRDMTKKVFSFKKYHFGDKQTFFLNFQSAIWTFAVVKIYYFVTLMCVMFEDMNFN